MGKLAKFFSRFSSEKFPKDSQGRRLNEPKRESQIINRANSPIVSRAPTTEGATKAAEAAMNRLAAKQVRPKTSTQRQVEAERFRLLQQQQEAEALVSKVATKIITEDTCNPLQKVMFWCPSLLGSAFVDSYSEVDEAIEKTLLDEVFRDAASAYTLLLIRSIETSQLPLGIDLSDDSGPSLTSIREKRLQNVATIIRNLLEHPERESFRQLRVNNKFISDLLGLKHASAFFETCGFSQKEQTITSDEGATREHFLIFPSAPTETQVDHLRTMLELLESGEPIIPKIFRDTTVLQASSSTARPLTRDELPAEFFFVSRDDLRKMVEEQQRAIDEGGMLLTRATRERLRLRERRIYRCALIRVRMPAGYLLQGTFLASESLSEIREWLDSCFQSEDPCPSYRLWAPPAVRSQVTSGSYTSTATPGNRPMTSRVALDDCDQSTSLVDFGLAPCALLMLSINEGDPKQQVGSSADLKLISELERQLSLL